MPITLTFNDEIAAQIEQMREQRGGSVEELAAEAILVGLRKMGAPFRTRTYSGGKALIENVDNVAEVLARVEDDKPKW